MAEAPAPRNRRQSKKAQDHHKTTNRKPRTKERRTWPRPQHPTKRKWQESTAWLRRPRPHHTQHTDQRNTKQKQKERQIKKTQDEHQWIVAQRLLSTLTIPGFS